MGAIFFPSLNFPDDCLDLHAKWIPYMSIANNTAIATCGALRFPSLSPIDESTRRWSSRLNADGFATLLTVSALTVMVGRLEREKAFPGWQLRWKH